MPSLVAGARALADEAVDALESLVVVESPSEDPQACRRALVATSMVCDAWLGAKARIHASQTIDAETGVSCLRWGPSSPRVLLLGHLDTVWPHGTLARLPFTRLGDRVTGPGVFDMKAGVVQALLALRLLDSPDDVGLLLTTDEEIGSRGSRAAIAESCSLADAVLVFEPSAGGALKTRRKGTSWYRMRFTGLAAHAGLDPDRGVNALLAAARAAQELSGLARGETTVTPTLMTAGTTANTVPAQAELTFDVRAWTADEQDRVDREFARYRASQGSVDVAGGVDRPALEASMSSRLFDVARQVAVDIGLPPLSDAAVGGASDGNLTAAAGVPTLDGLGAVGDGAHAEHEWASVSGMIERAALAAGIISAVLKEQAA